jgi:hypothetical protein
MFDAQGEMMARKDLERETERPRYYSQFWLDVAAGRRVIGGGKGTQEAEEGESAEAEGAPEITSKSGKAAKGSAAQPVVEAEPTTRRPTPPAVHQPLRLSEAESLADLAAAAGLIDIDADEEAGQPEEGNIIEDREPLPGTDLDLDAEPEEEVYSYTDVYADEEEEEEEEEEDSWPSSRRGKKHKKQEKPRRRERGRDF